MMNAFCHFVMLSLGNDASEMIFLNHVAVGRI